MWDYGSAQVSNNLRQSLTDLNQSIMILYNPTEY